MKYLARSRARVAGVGEMGNLSGRFVQEAQRHIVRPLLELRVGEARSLGLMRCEIIARFVALCLDYSNWPTIHEQEIVSLTLSVGYSHTAMPLAAPKLIDGESWISQPASDSFLSIFSRARPSGVIGSPSLLYLDQILTKFSVETRTGLGAYTATERLEPIVIVVDDVFTQGGTFKVMKSHLLQAPGVRKVRGLFLAKTDWPPVAVEIDWDAFMADMDD